MFNKKHCSKVSSLSIKEASTKIVHFFSTLTPRRGSGIVKKLGIWILYGTTTHAGCLLLYFTIDGIFSKNHEENFGLQLKQKLSTIPYLKKVLSMMQSGRSIYQYDDPLGHLTWYGKLFCYVTILYYPVVHFFPPKNRSYDEEKIRKNYRDFKELSEKNVDVVNFFYSFFQSFQEENCINIPFFNRFSSANALFSSKLIHSIVRRGSVPMSIDEKEMVKNEIKKMFECCIADFISSQLKKESKKVQEGFSESFYKMMNNECMQDFFIRIMAESLVPGDDNNNFFIEFISLLEKQGEANPSVVVNFLRKEFFSSNKSFFLSSSIGDPKSVIPLSTAWKEVITSFNSKYRAVIASVSRNNKFHYDRKDKYSHAGHYDY